MDETPVD